MGKINIKNRAFRVVLYLGTLTHVRHYRGYGVHSPFVYGFVRNIIMKRSIIGGGTGVYDAMRAQKLTKKASVQLQNLYNHYGYNEFIIVDDKLPEYYDKGTLYFFSAKANVENMAHACEGIKDVQGTAVILYPRHNRTRLRYVKVMSSLKMYLSIDNRRFYIFFFSNKYPKQHYKL